MEPVSVSQVNRYLKLKMDHDVRLSDIPVRGEISNFTRHKNGQIYFTLKDEASSLRVVMFRSSVKQAPADIGDGQCVVVHGKITVFERDGTYQLYANTVKSEGSGALTLSFRALTEQLRREGLFDESHKKALPLYPKKIGILTSGEGAALQDMLQIFGRRYPICSLVLYPVQVQGNRAPAQLIFGLQTLDARGDLDIIIIARGGGSAEDLNCFNNPELARAVYAAKTPIVSGVGHETDYTICDFTADLRVPTPSAAAEMCVPDRGVLIQQLSELRQRAEKTMKIKLETNRHFLSVMQSRPCLKNTDYYVQNLRERILQLKSRPCLSQPLGLLSAFEQGLLQKKRRLKAAAERILAVKCADFSATCAGLEALSPLKVLSRGYGLVTHDGKPVTAAALRLGDDVDIRFSDGAVKARIIQKTEE